MRTKTKTSLSITFHPDGSVQTHMKWLERDKKLYEGKNDRKGDEFEWDFEVTRK